MKTKLFTLLLAVAASIGTIFAESGTCGDNLTWDLTGGVLTISGTGDMYDFELNGAPWYSYRASIKQVSIGNSVTSIGEGAFENCTGLTSVTIGNSVTSIGEAAFAGCTSLTSITIPNSVTSIGDGAFYNCTGLTSVTIPNSVTSIGRYAFEGCTGLTSVTIPNSVTSIGERAFSGCSGLTSVTIPNSVTSIGTLAFYYCTGLTNMVVASGNTNYDSRENCNAIIKTSSNTLIAGCQNTIIPNSVTSIGEWAFGGCIGLTSVTIPNSVTSIGGYAFYNCTGLTSVTIPNSVTSIGVCAFVNCSGLTSVTIPNSVTSIGDGAFWDCSKIKSVTWNAKNCNEYNFGNQVESFTFGNEVEVIPASLCSGMNKLTSITIPNSVTSIGNDAFASCIGLKEVHITDLAKWCAISFKNSTANPLYYAHNLYLNNEQITNLVIPNSVTSIGRYAFGGCIGLTSVTIPNSVTSIGGYAFGGCTSLSSVVWNAKNYNDFSNTATPFYNNTNTSFDLRSQITSVVFGPDVEHIPAYICNGMTNLKILSIVGTKVKSIGAYAFQNVNSRGFRTLTLPVVQTIGESAFDGCSYLETIDFGANLESIGASAFKGCTRVSTMTCLADVTPDVEKDGLTSISEQAELYVLKDCVQKYKVDENWNRFTIKEKTAESTDVTGLTIIPEESTASIAWPAISGAATYELVIKDQESKDVCTLIFNSAGQLTSIAFNAPSRDGAPQHTQTAGFTFTITGLEAGTEYNLTITAKNASGQEIDKKNSSFHTNWPNGIENLHVDSDKPVKVLMDGQIYILRGEHVYDAGGKMVK